MRNFEVIPTGLVATMCLLLMSFNTDETAKPKSGINNTYAQDLSISSIQDMNALTINAKGEDLTVISFRLVVAPRTGYAYMKTFKGNQVYGNALDNVKNASVGDRVLIDQVMAQYGNGLKTYCDPAMHELIE